jgi:hypothetical protein
MFLPVGLPVASCFLSLASTCPCHRIPYTESYRLSHLRAQRNLMALPMMTGLAVALLLILLTRCSGVLEMTKHGMKMSGELHQTAAIALDDTSSRLELTVGSGNTSAVAFLDATGVLAAPQVRLSPHGSRLGTCDVGDAGTFRMSPNGAVLWMCTTVGWHALTPQYDVHVSVPSFVKISDTAGGFSGTLLGGEVRSHIQ